MEVPRHIGIIMDGNRRWAKEHKLKTVWQGHDAGAKKVEKVATWCRELGVKELTLYAFAIKNFGRSEEEVTQLFRIFRNECQRLLTKDKIDYKIRFIGRLYLLPADIQQSMQDVIKKTENNLSYTVNFAVAYGGRAEIVDAARKLVASALEGKISDPKEINETLFAQQLYLKNDVDLVIRLGNEKRLSEFLSWQAADAEFYDMKKLWPDIEKDDLETAIKAYTERDRRLGK
ncbi:di-trans,poly-cis-decaprenylcistransferase [Candidatus Woesearchaeota archaeon]|nr:di-trans,poly-cis-decaprenylcistransferase [Candidatus Woesearchaeota archaeon]